jgi:uncharacterized RDD family membrane protein YckC
MPFLWPYISEVFDQAMTAAESGNTTFFPDTTPTMDFASQALPVAVIGALVGYLYQLFFLRRWGATPGKLAVGIHVRLRERPGQLSTATITKRFAYDLALDGLGLLPVLGTLTLPLKALDLLWPAWDGKRQALHDKIAATNVVIGRRDPR